MKIVVLTKKRVMRELTLFMILSLAYAAPRIAYPLFVQLFVNPAGHLQTGMASIVTKSPDIAATPREFRTSTPGVSYVLYPDGAIEFRVPPEFLGVAITPDGRSLFIAN